MPSSKAAKRQKSSSKNVSAKYMMVGVVLLALLMGVAVVAPRFGGERNVVSAVELPTWLDGYPAEVREAYAYAAEHQDVLQYMSCYCGCENHGHAGNAACYVKDVGPDGRIQWDSHAAT